MIGSWIGIPTDVDLYYYMFNSAWFKSRYEFTVIFKSRPIASKSRHSYDIPHALHVHVADFQGNFWNGEAANAAANFILFRNGQHRTQCKALDGHTVRNYCCLNALHTALAWLVCVFAHISFAITPLYNIQLVRPPQRRSESSLNFKSGCFMNSKQILSVRIHIVFCSSASARF